MDLVAAQQSKPLKMKAISLGERGATQQLQAAHQELAAMTQVGDKSNILQHEQLCACRHVLRFLAGRPAAGAEGYFICMVRVQPLRGAMLPVQEVMDIEAAREDAEEQAASATRQAASERAQCRWIRVRLGEERERAEAAEDKAALAVREKEDIECAAAKQLQAAHDELAATEQVTINTSQQRADRTPAHMCLRAWRLGPGSAVGSAVDLI